MRGICTRVSDIIVKENEQSEAPSSATWLKGAVGLTISNLCFPQFNYTWSKFNYNECYVKTKYGQLAHCLQHGTCGESTTDKENI